MYKNSFVPSLNEIKVIKKILLLQMEKKDFFLEGAEVLCNMVSKHSDPPSVTQE